MIDQASAVFLGLMIALVLLCVATLIVLIDSIRQEPTEYAIEDEPEKEANR